MLTPTSHLFVMSGNELELFPKRYVYFYHLFLEISVQILIRILFDRFTNVMQSLDTQPSQHSP